MKRIGLSLLMGLVLLLAACKKEESTAPTKTELLTKHSWKVSKVKANNTELTDDLVAQVAGQAGLLGELYASDVLFKTDGSFTATNRTTKSSFSGTWSFNSDASQISITSDGQTIDFKITKLTSDEFSMNSVNSYKVTVQPFGELSAIVTLDLVPA